MTLSRTMAQISVAGALLAITLGLAACGGSEPQAPQAKVESASKPGSEPSEITLSARQIADAAIEVARPTIGGVAGAIELPATIAGDPQGVRVVSAALAGRVVALNHNLGDTVERGAALAILESREAATLHAEIEAAGARAQLAEANLAREQRLFDQKVTPQQDLIAARTAAVEARIALRLADQQAAATGRSGGALNRIIVTAPMAGAVIARSATLGQMVSADAELFRIANLSSVTITTSLLPADAGRVKPGDRVEVTAPGRRQQGRVTFVSPILDETTRLVPVIASLDNRAGQWRVGEAVTAAIYLPAKGDKIIAVPSTAVQMIRDKPVVFVRTATGFRAAAVTLARTDGDQVIVASGLDGSERIASTNSFILKAELGRAEAGDAD